MDDEGLDQALAGLKAYLDGPAEGSQEGETPQEGATGPEIEAQGRTVAPGGSPEADEFAARAVRLVTGMKAPQVKETLHLIAGPEDPATPVEVGAQRTLLISILERELRAGNPAVQDLF